jgi:hypothetical protein
MRTVKNITRFLIVAAVLWTQVVRSAAYDPQPVNYTGVVADNVQVIRDHIMDGVDDFIITATKGKETQKFILTCSRPENRLSILYWLKDITGSKTEGATGLTIQYYPEGEHQMNIDIDQKVTLMDSLLTANLTDAVSQMQDYKTGTFVFHFYENDTRFDHSPLAWSWQFPVRLLAPAFASALTRTGVDNCNLAQGETRIASLAHLTDHQ